MHGYISKCGSNPAHLHQTVENWYFVTDKVLMTVVRILPNKIDVGMIFTIAIHAQNLFTLTRGLS